MTIYKVKCSLGWRVYEEKFGTSANAREFVLAMLGKDKPKWRSSTRIAAKAADTLLIDCDQLEEVMESTGKGTIHSEVSEALTRFLFGVWKNRDDNKPAVKRPTIDKALRGVKMGSHEQGAIDKGGGAWRKEGATSLSEMCKQHGWDERRARRILRADGEQKQGRWQFAGNDVKRVETRLKQALTA